MFSLRDLLVLSIVAMTLPMAWRVPFAGLLTFSWLAYMRPQDLCWGIALFLRLSYVVGLVMFASYFAKEWGRRAFTTWDIRTRLMVCLLVVTAAGIPFAREQRGEVIDRLLEFTKIIIIALFAAGQIWDRRRLRLMMWVITLSLGFFGVKNGLYGILTGGNPIIRGPGGMLSDNNDFALALVMTVPLWYYMALQETAPWIKRGCRVGILLTVISILLTHSRGGFLALCSVAFLFWWRSRNKLIGVAVAAVGVAAFFFLAPGHVFERISTIQHYEADASARGRLVAWGVALRMIQDHPVMGVGFHNYRAHFGDYIDGPVSFTPVAHNSYLQIWAEGGTISFLIYLILLGSAFWTLRRLQKLGSRTMGGEWILNYSRMIEASLVGFVVGASFLNRGHFDLIYHLLGVVTALNVLAFRWASQPVGQREGDETDEDRQPLVVVPGRGFGRRRAPTFGRPPPRRPLWGR